MYEQEGISEEMLIHWVVYQILNVLIEFEKKKVVRSIN